MSRAYSAIGNTTGSFSKAAIEEASNPSKQQIDLSDGEEFMNKIAEYGAFRYPKPQNPHKANTGNPLPPTPPKSKENT